MNVAEACVDDPLVGDGSAATPGDGGAPGEAAPQTEMDALLLGRIGELVSSGPNERNWRGILIALVVIAAVLGLIVFSIVLLSPPDEGPRVKGAKFTLEDVLGSRFRPQPFNGTWISESELVFRDQFGGVSLLNADNLTTRVLMTNSTFRQLNAVDFRISSDLKYVLLIYNKKKVWTHSFLASYQVYEVETQSLYPLSGGDGSRLQLAEWSPSGSGLVFVRDNDLFYRHDPRRQRAVRLSRGGLPGTIFNGVPDWLYDEEILQSGSAVWWSPGGRFLLYASFNDSGVGELRFPWYGVASSERPQYPQLRTLRYPKVGTANPVVTLRVADLKAAATVAQSSSSSSLSSEALTVDVIPSPQLPRDRYLTSATWVSEDTLCAVWMNRAQNTSWITLCRGPRWACQLIHAERSSWWLERQPAPLFSEDGSALVTILPVRESELSSFQHVVRIGVSAAERRQEPTALTQGAFDVTQLAAWDRRNGLVYFVAAPEESPGERHLYRVSDRGAGNWATSWDCLTCPTAAEQVGDKSNASVDVEHECLFVQPHFSLGSSPRYYVLECLGPDPPFHVLVSALSNTRMATLDDLKALRDRLARMAVPQIKAFKVQVYDGFNAHVKLHLPPGLREDEDMVFPLVLHVNGAPGSQLVSSQWGVSWLTYLASRRNFIVVEIDGRGSGFQGDHTRQQLYRHLGSVEIEDQMSVVEYLRENLKFIDRERVAVWGWSYGGFVSATILANDEHKMFRCGMSVAPITSWGYYDSAYTERYMGLPEAEDNFLGYEQADLTKRVTSLHDKMFLLIHGTADHTVHYQQSMLLIRALTEEGVLFRHQTYPDEGNSFSGVKHHLFRVMESFLDDCFGPMDFEEWELGSSIFSVTK